MKKINNYYISTFVLLGFMFLTACNSIAKPELLPVLTTTEVNAITQTSATSGGNITSDAGSSVTVRGVCWSTKASPTIADSKTVDGAGIGSFTSSITGLTAGTAYFVRAYATSSAGTGYGGAYQITTNELLPPVLTTTEVSTITQTTATIGGNITSDAGSSVIARGVCWSTKASPTIADSKTIDGAGIGSFTSVIIGLTAGTNYFVRAYATSSAGTGYGNETQITTVVATPTVTDADGNVYQTITIGTQVWMVENLKTTKYNDGTAIPLVTDNKAWAALSTPAYCWYNNDAITYKNIYGALYNWYAVNTAKLAPTGWHVPTDAELTTLENYVSANLGTSGSVAKALAATTNWATSTSAGAIGNDLTKNNNSGFSALPGGYRFGSVTLDFDDVGNIGYWWSSTEVDTTYVWIRKLYWLNSGLQRSYGTKSYGFSVRCVRD